ncbi:MAG: CHASE2 domain-containing protein [Komarekiella atlantica HA4396-MV6]|nr:CHASE2 domain-containing protein [Komarekiella atlantica HA4396-MV6]
MISKLSEKINCVLPRLQRLYAALLVSGTSVIVTSAIATALVIGARQAGLLQAQELWAFDQFIQWRRDEGPDPRLLIIAITEQDLQLQKQWPLPDRTLAQLLGKLEQQQPRAIGLDIYRDLPVEPGNQELARLLRQSDRIITVCKVNDSANNPGIAPPPGVPENRIGFADLLVDSGGVLRRSLLFINPPPVNKSIVKNSHFCQNSAADLFSLSLRLALNYLKVEKIQPQLNSSNELKLGSTVFKRLKANSGGYQNVNLAGYQVLLNYRSPWNIAQQVTLTEVLTDKVNPSLIKNRVVLIGTTAESIKDGFYTPYSSGQQKNQEMLGVMIHAQAVSQILSAVLDQRPLFWYWPNWSETLWIGFWSLSGGIMAWQIRHPLRFGLASGVALGGLLALCFGFFYQGAWIPLVPSVFTFIATAGSVVIIDRFNKAGYTRAIYVRLKNPLKVNIEIDQSKKERQVAEITRTEYFQDLQKKGKELRSRKTRATPNSNSDASSEVNDANKSSQEASGSSKTEYYQQMQDKVKNLKHRQNKTDD